MADSDLDNAGVKAVITLGVLAFVGILAVVVAKIVQVCVKKNYTDDDGSEIDENTRDLIRARLSVIQFKKREIKKAKRERTLNVFAKWKEIVKNRKKNRDEALKAQRPEENGNLVITIDKLNGFTAKENGIIENGGDKIKENGSPRIPRFPFFTQNKTANVAAKQHLEAPRVASNKVSAAKQDLPVARGRPVSSKRRTLPNVTLTDVEINNSSKAHMKSVHFEDDTGTSKIESKSSKDKSMVICETVNNNKENKGAIVTVKTNVEHKEKVTNAVTSVTTVIDKPSNKTENDKGINKTNTEDDKKSGEKT